MTLIVITALCIGLFFMGLELKVARKKNTLLQKECNENRTALDKAERAAKFWKLCYKTVLKKSSADAQ